MRTQLTRRWVFEAAHRIVSHPGKCSSLHGHSWTVEVTVEGEVSPETGMVIDFADLKVIGDKVFMEKWDHAALLQADDPLVDAVEDLNKRHCFFDKEPTSETLCEIAAGHFVTNLPPHVKLRKVYIHETANCSAAVEWVNQ